MSTDAGYDQAVQQIRTLRTGGDVGGANWEAALLRVAEAETRYDIVYFITDGVPTFKVEKTPAEDQNPALEGKQSRAPIDSSGNVVAYYDVKVTNNSINSSELSAPVIDTIAFPAGMSVTEVDFYYENRKIADTSYIAVQNTAGRPPLTYEMKPALFGTFKGNESKTVKVRVTAKVDKPTQIEIAKEKNGDYQWCESPRPISPDNPRSMFNSVTLEGEHEPPNPQVGESVLTLGPQSSAEGALSGTIPVGTYPLVETKAPVGEKDNTSYCAACAFPC